jgi:uncharacterized membrane protein
MEKSLVELLLKILESQGFTAFIEVVVIGGLFFLFILERRDRMNAWKTCAQLTKETNDVLHGLQLVLEGINHKLK